MTQAAVHLESPAASAVPATSAEQNRLVLLVGNPNVGKTTLFNQLTGQNARVGNYPGVTVERRSGTLRQTFDDTERPVELVDVPGAYSLSARSSEEQIAVNAILGLCGNPRPDLVVAVVDASQLVRNLYLVLQLVELQVPVVVALNMIDEAIEHGPRADSLARVFGVPCVATDARRARGVDQLASAISEALRSPPRGSVSVRYPQALRRDVDRIADALPPDWRSNVERDRAFALWALTSLELDDELVGIEPALRRRCEDVRAASADRDLDHEVIGARYAFLDAIAPDLFKKLEAHPRKPKTTERLDRVLLHPVLGFAIFCVVMLIAFQALFSWSDPMIRFIERVFAGLQQLLAARLPASVLRDLLTEGIVGGVGNVLVFLPQILLLFLFIGILEDSGYMARVAYLMDRVMRALGLHGRAFVPMLSGFACAVPAILATRTMERQRDRLLTMLVIPLMTCSARLPVYTLIIAALFPPTIVLGFLPVQGLLMIALYLFSLLTTLVAAAVLGRTVVRGKRIPLILELPPYRVPNPRVILRAMWERSGVFVREAGTVILACSIVLWALLSFPRSEPHAALAPPVAAATAANAPSMQPADPSARNAIAREERIEHSLGGRLGKALEPALQPLGFDWKIGVGIIGAFAAREVFVSTLALVYGIGEVDDEAQPLRAKLHGEGHADGKPLYSPLTGLSLMLFFALACQCMSTLAVVRRETKSLRWPAFMFGYMTALAYLVSLLVYQGGKLLGFG